VKQEVGVATIAVGLITKPQQAEDILAEGSADIVALARELMYSADWPVHAARTLGVNDPLALFPPPYAFRLRRREEVAQLAINRPDLALPSEVARLVEST
jgi:2,4-dienoyl-CoA reductase-like NADH-dependent reductase (Old Yellow Enzyme family)